MRENFRLTARELAGEKSKHSRKIKSPTQANCGLNGPPDLLATADMGGWQFSGALLCILEERARLEVVAAAEGSHHSYQSRA
jgi:hypothetical protein